ncbi:hypothetical protein LX73_0620 [Fodinibius salinus]|uniref:HTTM domain-containing protein n=1 Tax=Fodinibius salinus TaxID=860790 RepID=A0A5D3YNR1_9BACT|nr:hypothetical protein [Fodinibius salinus]TYP95322.1 hypothetical protein LX73_0620 [Fodinibius salinus]
MTYYIFDNADGRDLGILRFTVFAIWLVIVFCTPLTNYALLPPEIFEPWGVFNIIFSDPTSLVTQVTLSHTFLLSLKIIIIIGCLLCMAGIRPFRWIAIPTVVLLLLAEGIVKGFNGYINHAELIPLYTAAIVSVSPSSDQFTILYNPIQNKLKTNYTFPIFVAALVFLLSYSFVGINRFMSVGLEIFQTDALRNYLFVNSFEYSKYGFDLGLLIAKNDWLLTLSNIGFFVLTVLECLSPLVLINRHFCYGWVTIMISFHILSLLTMNIFFWANIMLIILLFIIIPCLDGDKAFKTKFLFH